MRACFIIALAILGMLANRSAVQAQSYGDSGSVYGQSNSPLGRPGMFGSRTMGGMIGPGMRSFSGSSMGGGMDLGANRFLRENRQPGQVVGFSPETIGRFIGGNPSDTTSGGGFTSSTMYGGKPWSDSRAAGRNAQNQQSSPRQPPSQVRMELHVAFEHPKPSANRLSTSLARRLTSARAIQSQSPIQVEIRDRTAILRGTVTTEHDCMLAEQMVRLEPGIERVQNELVATSAMPPEPATP